jgi:hypothetical protein
MDKDELVRLAERCEAATGPDREVDAAIATALGLPHGRETGWCNKENGDYYVIDECAKIYTASLDAAMTLVPEGCSFRLYSHGDENHADVFQLGEITDNGVTLDRITTELGEAEMCKTPALAVCVAALYARGALRARSPEGGTDV